MVDFNKLKSNSGKNSLKDLNEKLTKLSGNGSQENSDEDNRFWQPTVDKAGNGYAVIRFLPAPNEEEFPFIRTFDHGFQGPTGEWYIEKSLTTIGKKDPVSEYNSRLWNTKDEDNIKLARKQKRRLHFISNIYVVADPGNPDNVGKCFLFKYGKKIFDKLNEAMNPEFDEQGRNAEDTNYDPTNAFNPFDFWTGANFKLKIRKHEGYRNYDKSEFESNKKLFDDDEKLEALWNKEYPLQDFLDVKHYKTYEELEERFTKVINGTTNSGSARAEQETLGKEDAQKQRKTASPKIAEKSSDQDEEDDDGSLEFFKNLANN